MSGEKAGELDMVRRMDRVCKNDEEEEDQREASRNADRHREGPSWKR